MRFFTVFLFYFIKARREDDMVFISFGIAGQFAFASSQNKRRVNALPHDGLRCRR
jgi:hypothetical protein